MCDVLTDLLPGESGTVHSIKGTSEARLHLMEMGLTPGTHVRVCRIAVLGGPLDISIRGYRLSLRRQEAAAIELRGVKTA